MRKNTRFVGLDVHKDSVAIAFAPPGRGPVEDVGVVGNNWHSLRKSLEKIADGYPIEVCYEAGPLGYELARRIQELGFPCMVAAPALIPRRAGERIKTDRRDARKLAHFLRSGDLSGVAIPDERTEAMRDLERARGDAKKAQQVARHQLDKFLLRHGRRWSRSKWTRSHEKWIGEQSFAHEAQRRVLAVYRVAVAEASERVKQLDKDIAEMVEGWALKPLVTALQAARGIALTSAVVLAAEIGDFSRFPTARQFMAFVGLAVSESSSGPRRRQGRITRAGNGHVRRILTEAAWQYRFRPVPSKTIRARRALASIEVQSIARKAELRLNRKYQRLLARGKKPQVAVTAVARELAGFLWAIARQTPLLAAQTASAKPRASVKPSARNGSARQARRPTRPALASCRARPQGPDGLAGEGRAATAKPAAGG